MDGQVGVIRAALDAAGHRDTGILAYTAKYASAFYGPFREAVESQLRGDRKTYQQDAGNVRESLRELALDLEEGADLVMVKPAMAYLDVLRAVAEVSDVPVAAYQVSGEYAMIEAAAANGWLDRDRTILETLTAIRRAGADVVLTYWATEVAARLGPRLAHLGVRRFTCGYAAAPPKPEGPASTTRWRNCAMSNDPASGGEQPGWHGQQPYPGGYGQQPEQPAYGSYPQPGQQPASRPGATARRRQLAADSGPAAVPGPPRGAARDAAAARVAQLLRRAVRLRLQLVRDPGRDQGAVHPGPGRDRAGLRRPRDLGVRRLAR